MGFGDDIVNGGKYSDASLAVAGSDKTNYDRSNLVDGSGDGDREGGGGGGYGYGSGSGSTAPTEQQKQAAGNQTALTQWGMQNVTAPAYDNGLKVLDVSNEQNRAIRDYQNQMAAMQANNEYFSNLLKEQSTYNALRSALGNGMVGSGQWTVNTLMNRQHDATAASIIENEELNRRQNELNYIQAVGANVNAANQLAADTQSKFGESLSDWAAAINNMNPELASGDEAMYDLFQDDRFVEPDWYDEFKNFFGTHMRNAAIPQVIQWTRPERAREQTYMSKIAPMSNRTNNSSAANRSYQRNLTRKLDALSTDYSRRDV